jgi:hypothetical protein
MNICIVTVYNSENCGSFLQAYALYETLKKEGHNVGFLERDVKDTSHALQSHIEVSIKKALKLQFKFVKQIWERYSAFNNAQRLFPIIKRNSSEFNNVDCFVIGSDTLWNLESSYFKKNIDTYFGLEFQGKKVITYAISVANTPKEEFNNSKVINGAGKMADISVRDMATYQIAKDVLKVNPTMVCDPTLLLSKKDYCSLISDVSPLKNSPILVYYFGNLPNDAVNQIKKLKEETGKQVISFGDYRPWCDINIPYNPYLFIQCYRDCSFVITNTYHGTIFSLIFEKSFADYGKSKMKIQSLLESLEAEKAFADFNEDLIPYYNNKPNYEAINKKISNSRDSSLQYLKRNLNN